MNLETASLQEIFFYVKAHLIQQGQPARIGPNCYYQMCGEDGKILRCAVGCLLPPEKYDPSYEGCSPYLPLFRDSLGLGHRKHEGKLRFLGELQTIHDRTMLEMDGTFNLADLHERLGKLAARYGLENHN